MTRTVSKVSSAGTNAAANAESGEAEGGWGGGVGGGSGGGRVGGGSGSGRAAQAMAVPSPAKLVAADVPGSARTAAKPDGAKLAVLLTFSCVGAAAGSSGDAEAMLVVLGELILARAATELGDATALVQPITGGVAGAARGPGNDDEPAEPAGELTAFTGAVTLV